MDALWIARTTSPLVWLCRALLAAVIVASPWLFAGAVTSHQAILAWGLFSAAVVGLLLVASPRGGPGQTAVRVPTLFWLAWGVLVWGIAQQVPLSPESLRAIAPAPANLWQELGPQGTTISLYPGSTRTEIARLLMPIGCMTLVWLVFRDPASRRLLFQLVVMNGTLLTLFGWAQRLTWNGQMFWMVPLSQAGVPFASFVNRNHAGGYLNLCLAAALALVLERFLAADAGASSARPGGVDRYRREDRLDTGILLSLATVLLAGGVFSTLSRGAMLSLLIATVAATIHLFIQTGGRRWLSVAAGITGLGAGGLALTWWIGASGQLSGRLSRLWENWATASAGRLDHWRDALGMIPDFWRCGSGWGTYRYIYPMYARRYYPFWYYHAENTYLEWFVDSGCVGLILALGMIALAFRASWKLGSNGASTDAMALSIAGTFALTSQVVHAAFDFSHYLPANALLTSTLVGILLIPENAATAARAGRWSSRLVVAFAGIGLAWSGVRLTSAAQLESLIARADQVLDQPDPNWQAVKPCLTELLGDSTKDSFDRFVHIGKLHELGYRLEAKRLIEAGLEGRMSPEILWKLTDPVKLHRQLHALRGAQNDINMSLIEPSAAEHLRSAYEAYLLARATCPIRAEVHAELAALALATGHAEEEPAHLRRWRDVAPCEVDQLHRGGLLRVQGGARGDGISIWREALCLSPRNLRTLWELSRELLTQEELKDLWEGLPDRVVELVHGVPHSEMTSEQTALFVEILRTAEADGKIPEAERAYFAATRAKWEGDIPKQLEFLERAVRLVPERLAWRLELAEALARSNRMADALENAQIGVETSGRDPRAVDLLRRLRKQSREE